MRPLRIFVMLATLGGPANAAKVISYSFDYRIARTVSGSSVGDYPYVGQESGIVIRTSQTGSGLISFNAIFSSEGTPTFSGTDYSNFVSLSIQVKGKSLALLRSDSRASTHVENTPTSIPVYDLVRITGLGQNEKWQLGNALAGFQYHPWFTEVFIGSSNTAISNSDLTAANFAALTSASATVFEGGQGEFGIHDATNPSAVVVGIMNNFHEIMPVPEASAWAMMIVGFGLIGAAARRKKSLAALGT